MHVWRTHKHTRFLYKFGSGSSLPFRNTVTQCVCVCVIFREPRLITTLCSRVEYSFISVCQSIIFLLVRSLLVAQSGCKSFFSFFILCICVCVCASVQNSTSNSLSSVAYAPSINFSWFLFVGLISAFSFASLRNLLFKNTLYISLEFEPKALLRTGFYINSSHSRGILPDNV